MTLTVVPGSAWKVERSEIFDESLDKMSITFPDLGEKLDKFLATKKDDPIRARYGKHDRRMIGDLSGFWHCHLRDDAILIYQLNVKTMTLIYIAPHAEIEGKRLKQTARRLHGIAA